MSVSEELVTYLKVLWRNKWMITACGFLAALVALGISFVLTPRFDATATLRMASASGGTDDYIYLLALTRLSNTYVELASSDVSLNEVAQQLGLQELPRVEVETVPDTELIIISATNTDPALARDIANTLANLLVEQSSQLYGGNAPTMREIIEEQLEQSKLELDRAVIAYDNAIRNAQSTSTLEPSATQLPGTNLETLSQLVGLRKQIYNELLLKYEQARTNEQLRANAITLIEPANLPENPSTPSKPLNAALGVSAGLAMGVILAFILEGLDDSIRGIEEVQEITKLPILCKIPRLKRRSGSNVNLNLSQEEILFPLPTFDQLCVRLRLFEATPKLTTFIITSPESGTGKSTLAANFALSLTHREKKVVLVDLDFHRPSEHSYLGMANSMGLSNVIRGEIQLDEALQSTIYPNLYVITAGSSPYTPLALLIPQAAGALLDQLRKRGDFVLIDMPGLPEVADPSALISQVDTIILVVANHITLRQNIRYALQQIDEFRIKIAGIVLNKVTSTQGQSYYTQSSTPDNSSSNTENR